MLHEQRQYINALYASALTVLTKNMAKCKLRKNSYSLIPLQSLKMCIIIQDIAYRYMCIQQNWKNMHENNKYQSQSRGYVRGKKKGDGKQKRYTGDFNCISNV